MSVVGKAAKHLLKKKSRSYTKKKASKKTRVARNKAKKHKDWAYDLAAEDRAFNSPQYGRLSKRQFKQTPPSKRVDPKRKKKHEIDLP